MKKLSILLSALAVVGLASCETDDTPVVNVPDTFTLNTPATADQYYELAPEGTITLTCSQPDYGFVAAAIYSVEISLDKNDVYAINTLTPGSTELVFSQDSVAVGMCKLRGIETSDQWTDPGYKPPLHPRQRQARQQRHRPCEEQLDRAQERERLLCRS